MAKLKWARFLDRRSATAAERPIFCIVTPVFNGATFIDETITSVLTQGGDFDIHYHIQDGGSTDDTLARVRYWQRLAPRLKTCRELVFTCTSEPDTGMYDAINKGFARALPANDDVVMGWIAADDRLAPGAFATMLSIRNEFPAIRFMGGRISLLDDRGSILGIHPLVPFSRRCMAAGRYDGRAMSFIMQEGTFWCADLWRKIGGLDPAFRLAGDWDLWRRLAAHADYVSVDSLLGFHRRRPGQLSEQMDLYYQEIDQALDARCSEMPAVLAGAEGVSSGSLRAAYESVGVEHDAIRRNPPRFRESHHAATAVRYNLDSRKWEQLEGFGVVADAPLLITPTGFTQGSTVLLKEGFRASEGPYPELGLNVPVRWMISPSAYGEVVLEAAGRYRVIVSCRAWIRDQFVTLLVDGHPIGRVQTMPYEHDRDLELSFDAEISAGVHQIGLSIEQPSPCERYLLIIGCRLEHLPVVTESQE